ncbi:MAG: dephospho-CoA kinase [Nanoarchaeota archaeon]
MIIGITGSVGSGKSTIAKIFSKHHYIRIDADEIAHKILQNKKIIKIISAEFGSETVKNNSIDREVFGNTVFNDDAKLKKLNSIMHPLIILEIKKEIVKIRKKSGSKSKIIVDAPLLLEVGAEDLVDKIIVIKASNNSILSRNRRFTKGQIENILKHQMPLEEKMKHADFMIDNDKNFSNTEKQITDIIKSLE